MSNQFHRLLTNAELHRPERTGRGNPNNFTVAGTEASFTIPAESGLTASDFIFNPEDGQYYQDLNTGDVYRFVKYSTLAQQQTSSDFVGIFNVEKRASGTTNSSVRVRNDDVSALSTISFTDDEQLLIQATDGQSQIVTVDGDQEFDATEFSIKVSEFSNNFDIGTFYDVSPTVSRFKKGGIWEKLVEYDRETETILNVANASIKSEAIGELAVGFGGEQQEVQTSGGGTFYDYNGTSYVNREDAVNAARADGVPEFHLGFNSMFILQYVVDPVREVKQVPRLVTQITTNLFTELLEGQEITVVSPNLRDSVKLTINNDGVGELSTFGPGEDIVLDVQDDFVKPFLPAGSLIFSEEGFKESSIKVDPSRIQLNVLGARGGDGIGTLVNAVGVGTTTQLSLKDIDEAVSLADNQSMILTNKFGDTKKFTVNGAQTLTTGTDTLNVDSIVIASGEPTFDADSSFVKEPSYSSSSRITVAEGNISLAVQEATDASNAVASLSLTVDSNSASISSQASLISANSSSITSIDQRVTSAEASITSQASLISSNSSSISTIDQRVTANEANITQSVQFDDSGASLILLAGPGGSQISISADTISLNDIDVIQDDGSGYGVIKSNNFSTGSAGWQIKGDGSAEFSGVVNFNSTQGTFTQNLFVESDGTSSRLGMFYQNNETFRLYNVADRTNINSIGTYVQSGTTYNKYINITASESVGSGDEARILVLPDDTVFKTVSGTVASVDIHPRLALNLSNTSFGTNFTGKLFIGGDIRWNATTSTSATAGSNGAVPSQVAGYVVLNISGTNYKLPYFNT